MARRGHTGLRVAVNLSTVQLRHPQLPAMIGELLQAHQLPAETLELEVTETGLMEDIDAAAHGLHSLRRSGALIAIDDFGTGYSSLSYLKSLPLDKIKIDKSFVQDISQDEGATIVRAIIQLGKSLGMTVIAEGVETPEQEAYLIAEGCRKARATITASPCRRGISTCCCASRRPSIERATPSCASRAATLACSAQRWPAPATCATLGALLAHRGRRRAAHETLRTAGYRRHSAGAPCVCSNMATISSSRSRVATATS